MVTEWLCSIPTLVQQIDISILRALNELAGNAIFDQTIDFISSNNFLRGTLPVGFYWFFWCKQSPDRSANRMILLKGIAATIIAILVARGIAHLLPSRVRPFADPTSGFVPFLEPNGRSFEDWSSFPSDTAAYEFALCWSLFYISRGWSVALLVYTAVFACVTRIYIGVHYPSDIAVGGAIGVLTAYCVQAITVPRIVRRTLGAGGGHPLFYLAAFYLTSELGQVFENVRDARRFLSAVSKLTGNHILIAIAGGVVIAVAIFVCGALSYGSRRRTAVTAQLEDSETRLPARIGTLESAARPEAV